MLSAWSQGRQNYYIQWCLKYSAQPLQFVPSTYKNAHQFTCTEQKAPGKKLTLTGHKRNVALLYGTWFMSPFLAPRIWKMVTDVWKTCGIPQIVTIFLKTCIRSNTKNNNRIIKVLYSPTDAQVNCLKNNIKIYIKNRSDMFRCSHTNIRGRIICAC